MESTKIPLTCWVFIRIPLCLKNKKRILLYSSSFILLIDILLNWKGGIFVNAQQFRGYAGVFGLILSVVIMLQNMTDDGCYMDFFLFSYP